MDLDTFKNTFIANGIPFSHVTDQIQIELLWNSLIFQIYKDRLSININELDVCYSVKMYLEPVTLTIMVSCFR